MFISDSGENGFETWASIARLKIRKICCPNGSRKLHFVQKIKLVNQAIGPRLSAIFTSFSYFNFLSVEMDSMIKTADRGTCSLCIRNGIGLEHGQAEINHEAVHDYPEDGEWHGLTHDLTILTFHIAGCGSNGDTLR